MSILTHTFQTIMAKKLPTTMLVLAGTPVEVSLERVKLDSLRLDPDNPRVRPQLSVTGRKKPATPTQLLDLMREQDGYQKLHKQIRDQKGISDPLMIRSDGRIVEGNTRFAVLSTLVNTAGGQATWGMVPVLRLPQDAPESAIQLQMAGFHISGKTNWRPSAQAAQIHRLLTQWNASIEDVAHATRMNPKKIRQYLDAYDYLVKEVLPELEVTSQAKQQELLDSRFSHALQLMTVRALKPVRENKAHRKWLARQIANNRITGQQVRKVDTVINHPQARKALEGGDFHSARMVLKAENPAAESKVIQAVTSLTKSLNILDQKDLQLFLGHAESRASLEALIQSAENVLAMGKKTKRRA